MSPASFWWSFIRHLLPNEINRGVKIGRKTPEQHTWPPSLLGTPLLRAPEDLPGLAVMRCALRPGSWSHCPSCLPLCDACCSGGHSPPSLGFRVNNIVSSTLQFVSNVLGGRCVPNP